MRIRDGARGGLVEAMALKQPNPAHQKKFLEKFFLAFKFVQRNIL